MAERSIPLPDDFILRRVWKSTGLLVLGRLWGSACTLTILFVLAHHLEPAGFGRFTFYLAAFALLDSLTDLGTGSLAVQRTADDTRAVGPVLATARRILGTPGKCMYALPATPPAGRHELNDSLMLHKTTYSYEYEYRYQVAILR